MTNYQTEGRGRLSRRWVAPSGSSLLFSLLFRPAWPAFRSHWLTMLGCLAVIEAVKRVTGLDVKVKWPNDLILKIDGVWHKFGGILVEGEMEETLLKTAVFGAGINVNIHANQLPKANTPATSLMIASGQEVDRVKLFATVLNCFEPWYEKADQGQSPLSAWREKLITLGQSVEVAQLGERTILSGTAVDVDEYGRLLIQDQTGKDHLIQAGDVTLRGHFDN